MTLKEALPVIIGCITLMGVGYGAALKGGWIINESRASEIAQQAVEPETIERMEFVRETKFNRLRFLNALESKSPDDLLEMETLRDDIERINDRLAELEK